MSKLTKLINNPILFIKDSYKNISKTENAKFRSLSINIKNNNLIGSDFNLSRVNWILPIKLMIHTGESRPGRAHLNQWITQFMTTKEHFVIVVRNNELYKWLGNEYPWISIAFLTTPIQIESFIKKLPLLRAIFYPSNTGNNIHLLRFNHLEHIFIGHGDSDKSGSAHKFFRAYDEVWVAGQAHIDRFKNAEFDSTHLKFKKIGRPNLTSLMRVGDSPWRDRFKKISVLYLPTWEGVYEEQNYSSLQISGEILSSIGKIFEGNVLAKLHPQTGQRDKSIASIEIQIGRAMAQLGSTITIKDRATPIETLLLMANIFICDISAVVTDCLSLNAPIFVYIPNNMEIKLSSSFIPFEQYAYTFSSTEELIEKISIVISGNDELAENRAKAIDYFVGRTETIENEFKNKINQICL